MVIKLSSNILFRFFTTLTNFKVRSKNWVKTMPFWKIQLNSINLNFLILPVCIIPASSYLLNESDNSFNGPHFLTATILGWVAVLIYPSTDCLSKPAFNLPLLMSPSLYLVWKWLTNKCAKVKTHLANTTFIISYIKTTTMVWDYISIVSEK